MNVIPVLTATVNCDASFCPMTRAAGWAVWISMDTGRFKYSGRFHELPKDPGEAEFWAMCNGAWYAVMHGATHLLIQGDCQAALRRVDHHDKAFIRAIKCTNGKRIAFRTKWVKGHTAGKTPRTYVNNWCDEEAKKHMRKQRKELRRHR